MIRFNRVLALVMLATIAAPATFAQRSPAKRRPEMIEPSDQGARGLEFRLSDATPGAPPSDRAALPAAEVLPADAAETILGRLSPIPTRADDRADFALRERSLPAPRTGDTIKTPFPVPETPPPPDMRTAGPFEVVRRSPEGEVPIAPSVSITFSQPAIALDTQQSAASSVPATISPAPPGRWRWVGTRTLLFEPEGRAPMATHYTVEVPASARSADGQPIARAERWTFSTPPPSIKWSLPAGSGQSRDPLFFVGFDQRIDRGAILPFVRVRAGQRAVSIRLATDDQVSGNPAAARLAKEAGDGRWIAFRAVGTGDGDPLPAATPVTVALEAGAPSAEGPRTTERPQGYSFETYGPLRVIAHRCGWNGECPPLTPWSIEFSNPLDLAAFDPAQVRVTPELPGKKVEVYGSSLVVRGVSKGRTTYTVTLDPAIRDIYGQTLGTPALLTFKVGSAPATLFAQGGNFITLDPAGRERFSVFSINQPALKVRLHAVQPSDWARFAAYMSETDPDRNQAPPGRLAHAATVPVRQAPDEIVETSIDLSPALRNGLGHVVVVIEPTIKPKERWRQHPIVAWVQATNLGLDAFVDDEEMVAWANSLVDGSPAAGARFEILPAAIAATAASDGTARIPLPPSSPNGPNVLVARHGADVAILPENLSWWGQGGGWHRRPSKDSLRWYVFDDRKMYRPGERVHVKGWIRRIGAGELGDVEAPGAIGATVSFVLADSRGNEILKGQRPLTSLGGFDLELDLPSTMNLGTASLRLGVQSQDAEGAEAYHGIEVQEFRRPEFEVSASADPGPHFVGGGADVTVNAAYYAGGPLPNAEVSWAVTSRPGYYTPPNWGEFTFGTWVPWWEPITSQGATRVERFTGRTDPTGAHRLHIDFLSVDPPRPSSVTAEATVMDVNRQAWTATSSMLVHPADLYVGVRATRTFVEQGRPIDVDTVVVDVDGRTVAGREARLRLVRLEWTFTKGAWVEGEQDPQEIAVSSTDKPVRTTFRTTQGGRYRLTATVRDDRERLNQTEMSIWVAGGKVPPSRKVEQERVTLIPDKKDYRPGETAEILVQSPFAPAEGVMTIRRSGIVSSERFTMEGSTTTLRVPVRAEYLPSFTVQVDLVGSAPRPDDDGRPDERLPKRPAFAVGSIGITIPPVERTLTVTASPASPKLEPGAETAVDLTVKDVSGAPVRDAEVALVVVDEAVLALTGYRIVDPISVFYTHRGPGGSDFHSRTSVLLASPKDLEVPQDTGTTAGAVAEMAAMPGAPPPPAPKMARALARNGDGQEPPQPIAVRTNFDPLAVFAPASRTDADGHALVSFKMPDNLTRYRVTAVAVAGGKQFGSAESSITARLPLMVRPSAPRFLNFGDAFELPVVVQNQTDAPMEVDVAVRGTNVALTAGNGRRVTVPANDRVEVRFPAAAEMAGVARFQVAGVSGRWSDAAEFQLPVWTPATTEAFATYGEIDSGAIVQPIASPRDVVPQFGGLEVTTSSTQLQALTDAVLYLQSYPYECAEQLSSRVISVAALKDVLAAFKTDGLPSPEEMVDAVGRDLKRLQGMQNDDGGFGFWKRGEPSWPFVSIHVAHALARARSKDFAVPPSMIDRALGYLRTIEGRIPSWYSVESRRAIVAYALYTRNLLGDRDIARARKLVQEAAFDGLSLEALGWIIPVLSGDAASATELAAIRRHLNNRVSETAGAANFVTRYSDGEHVLLHSDRRTDGVLLDALIVDQPKSDLIPKLVRGLLAHRTKGRWLNTQENVFILLALDRYFRTYENVEPNFVARVWLGERFAGEHAFRGRTTERAQIDIPMRSIVEPKSEQKLTLAKEGPGRLFYRLGLTYAPASLKLASADYGFSVERTYEWVDKPEDVKRDADGSWRVRAGARVRVKLTMVAPSRRYHVALVDPMPAGFEALNPALAVTGSVPTDGPETGPARGPWWWFRTWYEHQNLRDERAEAFSSLVWEGVYTYSYVARATTPGSFVVPPSKAEEMYSPETFGRGSTDRVIVE